MSTQQVVTERTTRIAGFRTRTLSIEGDGPVILLLHGFSDSADTWRPVLRELASTARHVVAVDLPGHGYAEPVAAHRLLSELHRFTTELVSTYAQSGDAVLAGNSLGGLLALRAAQRDGLPLAAVAGISPAGLAYATPMERIGRLSRSRLAPAVWSTLQLPIPAGVVRGGTRLLYQARLSEGMADPELAKLYASHFRGMDDVRRFGRYVRRLDAENRAAPLLDPAQIRHPVLLIWGRRDPLVPVAASRLVLDVVPESRLVVFEDCGHCAQVQRPAEVAHLISTLPGSASAHRGSLSPAAAPHPSHTSDERH